MIDLNKPLQVRDESDNILQVRIVENNVESGGDYPILAYVGEDVFDPDDQTVVRFAEDGESRKGKHTLENVPEAAAASNGAAVSGSLTVPAGVLKVRHAKYGTGTVIKVRAHEAKSTYVEFSGGKRKWVFDRKLSAAA